MAITMACHCTCQKNIRHSENQFVENALPLSLHVSVSNLSLTARYGQRAFLTTLLFSVDGQIQHSTFFIFLMARAMTPPMVDRGATHGYP